jgi:hypothetical protein
MGFVFVFVFCTVVHCGMWCCCGMGCGVSQSSVFGRYLYLLNRGRGRLVDTVQEVNMDGDRKWV